MRYLLAEAGQSYDEIEVGSLAEALEIAEANLDPAAYRSDATTWVKVSATDEDGDYDYRKITIEPLEPACVDSDGHRWTHGDTYGHGGGVIWDDRCAKCDLIRTTCTWDYDRVDGEQGLRSTTYAVDW